MRKSARVLLVHGEQGTGKTLFAGRVEDDFKCVKDKKVEDEQQNLWIVLAGGDGRDQAVSEQAARGTELRRIEARSGWLEEARVFAKANASEMRVFLIDDVHKDVFLREWAELGPGEYTRFKVEGHVATVLESVAQRLVEDCRGDFRRSVFVLLSNNKHVLEVLHQQLELSHQGLAQILSLPVPGMGGAGVTGERRNIDPRSDRFRLTSAQSGITGAATQEYQVSLVSVHVMSWCSSACCTSSTQGESWSTPWS